MEISSDIQDKFVWLEQTNTELKLQNAKLLQKIAALEKDIADRKKRMIEKEREVDDLKRIFAVQGKNVPSKDLDATKEKMTAELLTSQKKIKEQEETIKRLKELLMEMDSTIEALRKERNEAQRAANGGLTKKEARELHNQNEKLKNEIHQIRAGKLPASSKAPSDSRELDIAKQEVKLLKSQNINLSAKNHDLLKESRELKKIIEEQKKRLSEEENLRRTTTKSEEMDMQLKALQDELDHVKKINADLEKKAKDVSADEQDMQALLTERDRLNEELHQAIENGQAMHSELAALREEMKQLDEDIKKFEDEKIQSDSEKEALEKEYELLKEQMDEIGQSDSASSAARSRNLEKEVEKLMKMNKEQADVIQEQAKQLKKLRMQKMVAGQKK